MRNMVQYQKRAGKCHRTPGDRRERMVSPSRRCRSTHGSTRSNSRQCSEFRDRPQRHSQAILSKYRVCGSKSCSSSGAVYQRKLHLCRKSLSDAIYAQLSNFLSRNSVILACSAAARRSSVSESCWIRSCIAVSISPDVLPVAQIMKINPNFCS